MAELLLGEAELLNQRRAGPGLVDRVEVLPHDVLDQRRLQPLCLVRPADDRGDGREPGFAGRAPAPLAGDELVATVGQGPNDQRLHDARVGDRGGQAFDRLGVDARPRLARIGANQIDRELTELCLRRRFRQDCGEPAPHSPPCQLSTST